MRMIYLLFIDLMIIVNISPLSSFYLYTIHGKYPPITTSTSYTTQLFVVVAAGGHQIAFPLCKLQSNLQTRKTKQ